MGNQEKKMGNILPSYFTKNWNPVLDGQLKNAVFKFKFVSWTVWSDSPGHKDKQSSRSYVDAREITATSAFKFTIWFNKENKNASTVILFVSRENHFISMFIWIRFIIFTHNFLFYYILFTSRYYTFTDLLLIFDLFD